MSVVVRNGKVAMEAKPKGIDAPTPSQIAERAYELAIAIVRSHAENFAPVDVAITLEAEKAATLAALRNSVINPDAIPWWRK